MSSSFRNIRPLSGTASSASQSHATTSEDTAETSGSDPNRRQYDVESASGLAPLPPSTFKRRRVPESVTRNACTNCKKARAKCDGKQPQCTRCSLRAEIPACKYETHIKHAKEELLQEIKVLKDRVHNQAQILQALSAGEKVDGILERLQSDTEHTNIVRWLGRSGLQEEYDGLSPRESRMTPSERVDQDMTGTSSYSVSKWTSVVADDAFYHHLFQLYFAWIHPVHTLFSEGHFVASHASSSPESCSPALVNAICAMACHLHSGEDAAEVEEVRRKFSDAARTTLDPSEPTLTSVQAFAVMFLVDCARGRCLRASSYLSISCELLSRILEDKNARTSELVRQTHRGLRSLSVEWSQLTFQVPVLTYPFISDPSDDNDLLSDKAKWYFYRENNDQCPAWPGLLSSTNKEKAKLIEIINEAVMINYSPGVSLVSARRILQIYDQLISWKQNLPSTIGDTEDRGQPLPHILSLLILRSTAIVQLIRPIIDFPGLAKVEEVKRVVWWHAQQGLYYLSEHYKKQFTTRYQPVLQMHATLHLCDTIARYFPNLTVGTESPLKDGQESILLGLESLETSRRGFPVAGALQSLLKKAADDLRLSYSSDIESIQILGSELRTEYTMDDYINACTRPTYLQPVSAIRLKYSQEFAREWTAEALTYGFGKETEKGMTAEGGPMARTEEERGAQSLMQIRNLLNMA